MMMDELSNKSTGNGTVMDVTESTMGMNDDVDSPTSRKLILDNAEASFPSPEEIRTSSTSRINSKKHIWSGSRSSHALTSAHTDRSNTERSKRRICISLVVIALLVLFVIVPAMVASSKNKNVASDNNNNYDTNSGPTGDNQPRPNYGDIADFIVGNRISTEANIDTADTPQAQAILWLMRDDPANIPVPTSAAIDSHEAYMYMVRYIMAVNFFALKGLEWNFGLNFLMLDDVCDWNDDLYKAETIYRMGLFCAPGPGDTEGELVNVPYMLHLESNGLSGSIPSENGLLTSLQKFTLTFNDKVSGEIPMEICTMKNLRSLHLSNNQLTGPMPLCFSEMPNLQLLDLTGNKLNDKLPETLCQVPLMNELLLGLNQFTGPIPPCFGSMPSLTHLVLHGNQLDGGIPTNLCQLPNLLNLDFGTNLLQGEIPPCIGSIPFLQGLDLSNNTLTGSLPIELGELSDSLRILSLNGNQLTGDPSALFNELIQLRVLFAANNNFTFAMDSTFLKDTTSLKHLDLSANRGISGFFPEHLLAYTNLVSLDLSTNQLAGEFPIVINNNPTLEILAVHSNLMSGSIASLTNLSQLLHLDLSKNRFTGDIDSIGELKQLKNLFLSENLFDSAPIPPSFGELKLLELSLRNTSRTGELLDPIIDNWISMRYIDFGSNNLEGTIPTNYGLLPFLQYLILHDNDFLTDTLPSTFQYSTELVGVFLDGTSITPQAAIELLCTLPNFSNRTIAEEVFIVNCLDTCSDQCSGCICCDPAEPSKCSESYFDLFDIELDETYRRTSNFYTVTETVGSTFEDH